MATAVIDLDIQQIPDVLETDPRFDHAFLLLRYKGTPVGRVTVPVIKGKVLVHDHEDILDKLWPIVWKHSLEQHLDWDERRSDNLPTATVAICTRNRTEDLKKCLDGLMLLQHVGEELIVIDNCPSDDSTKKLVALYPTVKYFLEPVPGLDNARNRAITEASNEVVAFCDDDAVPDPGWLRSLLSNFTSEKIACVTGLTMPLELETPAQIAFETFSSFNKGFERKTFSGNTQNPLSTGRVGAGANMAIRKSVVADIGNFDPCLDAGTVTQSGGDHEFFARILIAGYQIVYDPAALSWHRHRRSWQELRATMRGYGVGVYSLLTRHLLMNGELTVVKIAWSWFWYDQLPDLIRNLFRKPNRKPLDLVLAELSGCLAGPWAYIRSRKNNKAGNS